MRSGIPRIFAIWVLGVVTLLVGCEANRSETATVITNSQNETQPNEFKKLEAEFFETARNDRIANANAIGERFLELARAYPDSTTEFQCLSFVVRLVDSLNKQDEATSILIEKYANDERLRKVLPALGNTSNPRNGEYLEALINNSTSRSIRADATLGLIGFLSPDKGTSNERLKDLFKDLKTTYADVDILGGGKHGLWARSIEYKALNLSVGRPAMEIGGEDLKGESFKLSDYRGKVVVLSFWDSSGVCQLLYDRKRSLVEQLEDKPFVVIGVNSDKNRDEAQQTITEKKINWRSFWDQGPSGSIAKQWKVNSTPMIFVIDADGHIRYRRVLQLKAPVAELLKEVGHDLEIEN